MIKPRWRQGVSVSRLVPQPGTVASKRLSRECPVCGVGPGSMCRDMRSVNSNTDGTYQRRRKNPHKER